MTYNEALLRAKNFGSGLVALGLQASNMTFIGIYAINCPEWIITEQACYTYSMVLVPLYDTLGADACAFIIAQAEITTVICEDDVKCNYLLEQAPKNLKKIISMKQIRPATRQRAKNRGIDILIFHDVERLGAQKDYAEVVSLYPVERIFIPEHDFVHFSKINSTSFIRVFFFSFLKNRVPN